FREPVEALFVSVPAATVVDMSKLPSPELASPDPPSEAEQAMVTSLACQAPSGEPQLTLGAFRSTLMPVHGPAAVQWFTLSQTCRDAVEALESSVLEATLVDRLKLESPTLARPDPPSEAEHATSTSCWCQNPSADPQLTTGALRSTLKVYGPAVAL